MFYTDGSVTSGNHPSAPPNVYVCSEKGGICSGGYRTRLSGSLSFLGTLDRAERKTDLIAGQIVI